MPARYFLYLLLPVLVSCSVHRGMFRNPLLTSGADPWSIYQNDTYYYTQTMGDRIVLWRTNNLANLNKADKKTIFIPPPGTNYSRQLWAPEIHYLNGSWYVYFAADDGDNNNHRMYVIENKSNDPFEGLWTFKGKVSDSSDKWAIDGSVFYHRQQLYMIWSGWEGDVNGRQDIYIAQLENPWTMKTGRVRISSPEFDWEKHGDLYDDQNLAHVYVNEGPQYLHKNNRLFIIYSASGCWTDNYGLGMLMTSDTSNLMDSAAWHKHPQQLFSTNSGRGVYAPGHNSFFISPDGSENWILYHANSLSGQGCGKHRSPRAQKFYWKPDDTPDFGVPVETGKWLSIPSANKLKTRHKKTT